MVFLRFSSVFLRFSYGFLRFETSGKPEENRKKTGRKPEENQKKTKRKPKENQKKTKRKPKKTEENQKKRKPPPLLVFPGFARLGLLRVTSDRLTSCGFPDWQSRPSSATGAGGF